MTPGFGTLSEECFSLRDPETANGSNMEVTKAQLVLLLDAIFLFQPDLHYSSLDQTAAFGQSKHGKSQRSVTLVFVITTLTFCYLKQKQQMLICMEMFHVCPFLKINQDVLPYACYPCQKHGSYLNPNAASTDCGCC